MPVKLNSSAGGSVTLDVPATATDTTLTLPATGGTLVTEAGGIVQFGAGSVSAPSITAAGDTNTGMWFPAADTIAFSEGGVEALRLNAAGNAVFTGTVQTAGITTPLYPLVQGTPASATGTSIDFTGIPSWARRITVMFNGVSTNGTSSLLVQLGTSAGIVASGYTGSLLTFGPAFTAFSTGFLVSPSVAARTNAGHILITNILANAWVESSSLANQASADNTMSAGAVTLAGPLDRVRITTVNGTDAFDNGIVNILWE
jgi:hypothetical protein